MTIRKIKSVSEKCTNRITANLNDSEKLLIESDFANQEQYNTLASYFKAILLGKAENRKSTILTVPSINESMAKTLKSSFSNLNQHMKHMNVIEKELGSREDYRATFIIITKIITSLQLTMTSSVSLIDKSSKSKSQVKAMASHVFNADDYLDLLLMVQLEDSIDKQWDLGETE